ncbi:uncharacterized protein LOC131647762 [Vicia villosa]|uniref:uncharacterized protein LOC131647762 n=1 Tax=Vicia villosa TaxID=3911 RepID=UPI00273B13A3|nr:uncharacterized protein LOC131647762 [Vicia villosa]
MLDPFPIEMLFLRRFLDQAKKFLSTTLGSESGVNAIFTNGSVTCPIDEGTFFSADLHLLESIEIKNKTKHILEIIEEVKWKDAHPDLLTRFHFVFALSLLFRVRYNVRLIEVVRAVSKAWERRSSNDIRFCLLLLINAYIRPVPILNNLRAKGFSTLNCMLKNCGCQVFNCLLDPNCRKALQCLNKFRPVDQVY